MPEGDTLRRLADRINRRFAGQQCVRCVTRDPRLVGVDLAGSTMVAADAFGKHLMLRFDDGRTLHAHLLMTGSWVVGPAPREPAWRRRVELWFEGGRLTALDVPVLGVISTANENEVIGHLGPDLCAADPPDIDEVVARLQRDPGTPLAAALLDQRNVAGFGNLYAIELPFIVGVSPNQLVGHTEGLTDLVGMGTAIIRVNARSGVQNTTGRKLSADDHWIYPKRGRPCPVCATKLEGWTERESPWLRVSIWCPSCQQTDDRRCVDIDRARRLLALHPARREPTFPR